MIKIVTGWSNPGGSTVANINLTNLLNTNGIPAILYGPHEWHKGRCKSGQMEDICVEQDDVFILHFLPPAPRIPVRKVILSCHETELINFGFGGGGKPSMSSYDYCALLKTGVFDAVHFVSRYQRDWHNIDAFPNMVIPNVLSHLDLLEREKHNIGCSIAGVIGSIDPNKNTHEAIQAALYDGCSKVILYGIVTNEPYYSHKIQPLIDEHGKDVVAYAGHCDDQEMMYGSVDVVYHRSKMETFNMIAAECELTGTLYDGPEPKYDDLWLESDILEAWKNALGIS